MSARPFAQYASAVNEYTGRYISDEEDAYDAFAGVLELIGRGFEGKWVYALAESHFEAALTWQKGLGHWKNRRLGVPWWSWVCWSDEQISWP